MSDDVRARAEADLAGSVRWALDHCEAGVMPSGGVLSLRAALLAYNESRAALAVAPATAQPWAWVVMGNRGTRRSPPYLSREEAERCVMELDRGEFLEDIAQTPHRVVPLYAAPPATAQPVAWACDKHSPSNCVGSRWVMVCEWTRDGVGKVPDRCCDEAVPLYAAPPATGFVGQFQRGVAELDAGFAAATAVEEARGAVSSLAFARRVLVATLLDHDEIVCGDWRIECELDPANLTERFAFSTPKGETMYDTAEEAVDALLAAEAADEGHTLAAKESRSDDSPASGQGGV